MTLESLNRGREYFNVNCAACHGPTGGGDGPIAAPNGPIAGVLPIGPGSPMGFSLAPGLTDGHIYTTISLGSRPHAELSADSAGGPLGCRQLHS